MRKYSLVFSILLVIFFLVFCLSCGNKKKNSEQSDSNSSNYSDNNNESNSYESDDEKAEENEDVEEVVEEEEEKYPDGTYCAEVEYSNPNTGTNSSYTLTVEVEGNEITQINWPNGGMLDQDHFSGAELDKDGSTSFTSDMGYDYEVQVTGSEGDCITDDVPVARQCRGVTEDGTQCENMTDNPNGLCWQHQDQE